MGWLDIFRKPFESKLATVSFDDEAVTCRHPGGVVETVKWSDLQHVQIETTDAGPALDDVFWVLKDGNSGCVIPSESKGIRPLLERIQRLPNFDNEAAIQAMSCTDNQRFVCWQRSNLGSNQPL